MRTHRQVLQRESGFTVIEASIAMFIAAMVFVALSAGLIAGLRSTREARLFQEATSLGDEAVEETRDHDYDELGMVSTDITGDPLIVGGRFDPDGSGPLLEEPVVVAASGASVNPHIKQQVFGNTTFTVKRYVTWVDADLQGGPDEDYKRVVTIVEWPTESGVKRSFGASTLITRARRGLPAPKFELAPTEQDLTASPGNIVHFGHSITNLGIADTYDITFEKPATRDWVITLYRDVDEDGLFDALTDTPLTDTNDTGIPDTDSVAPGESIFILLVWALSPVESPGTALVHVTATSGIDNEVSHSATNSLIIGSANLELNLHNRPTPPSGDTTAQTELSMNIDVPSATTLYRYSTDLYPAPTYPQSGRFVEHSTGNENHTEKRQMVNWVFQVPERRVYNGQAVLRLYVAKKDFNCTGLIQFKAFIRVKNSANSNGGTLVGTGDGVVAPAGISTCGFQLTTVTIGMGPVTIDTNKWIELKLVVSAATASPVLFAYDTIAHRSSLRLPQVLV